MNDVGFLTEIVVSFYHNLLTTIVVLIIGSLSNIILMG